MVRKAFLYRLYPSRAQAQLLDTTLEICRCFYNDCLAERKTAYQERGEPIGKFEQLRHVKEYKAINPSAKNIHSHILQTVVQDLDKAFKAFFRRVKAGEKAGYPRFKGRNRWHSFGYKELGNGFKIDGRRLKLTGIGRIAVRWHRPLEGHIKTVRVSKRSGKWYAAFSCVVEDTVPLEATNGEIGIDVGLSHLIMTSEGETVAHPRFYRSAQRRLRVAQRRVARRKKGSMNRQKAVAILQHQYERITNQRKDFLNKLAHRLIGSYDHIALEDLSITNMIRNPRMAKSILDAGWGYLVQRLTDKAASAGRVVVLVDPRYTSKTCSQCGYIFESLSLADRWIHCACGLSLDRDHNAAINILKRAGRVRWASSSSIEGFAQEAASL